MDVPAHQAGTVAELKVRIGRSCQPGGDVIMLLEATGAAATPPKDRITRDGAPAPSYGSPSGVYETIDVRVPDIGDFKGIPLIEGFWTQTLRISRAVENQSIRRFWLSGAVLNPSRSR
jgi:pyruvate/2-oxoglutarate dehydrogenase complex dihydrolipoamide acyltransferase (E2) component